MLNAQHVEFVRTRQAAVHSFEGYDTPISRLRTHVAEALGKVNLLMARQGRVLELVAIDELVARRERLETYEDQARYALADSYDRATKARAMAETAALQIAGRRSVIRPRYIVLGFGSLVAAGCASTPDSGTLAALRTVEPDVAEVEVADTLDLAMQSYRRYLNETPTSVMTPEAMRRLADLQLEKEFGITGGAPTQRWTEMAAPEAGTAPSEIGTATAAAPAPTIADAVAAAESDEEFERRAAGAIEFSPVAAFDLPATVPERMALRESGPLEAIKIYERLLTEYPNYERRDQVLYQMARAYDELGQTEQAMDVMQRLVGEFGYSRYSDEVQFRRGEYYFTRRRFREAEGAYETIASAGARSEFYELSLYKLGWSLYKQDFYEEALHRYMALLDYKVSVGYDFDQAHAEEDERRVTDTFRVISLSFSNLGGPDTLAEYYGTYGERALRRSHLPELGRVLFRQDALRRRRGRLRLVRRPLSVPPRVARVQHARHRHLRRRRLPEARRRVEEIVCDEVRLAERVLAALRRGGAARGADVPQDQPRRTSRTTITRSIRSPRSRRRSRRTTPRLSSGIERSSRRSRRTSSRPASTTSSPTCCSRTTTSARPRASTSARPTATSRTTAPPRPVTPPSSRIASS